MKKCVTVIALFLTVLVFSNCYGRSLKRAWWDEKKPIAFFSDNGFEFKINNLSGIGLPKKSIEILVILPDSFVGEKRKNSLESVLLFNEDVRATIRLTPYKGKKKMTITLSEDAAKKSKLYFYYKNNREDVTEGSQFILSVSEIISLNNKDEVEEK